MATAKGNAHSSFALVFFLALQILSTSTVVAFRAIAGHVDATHASHFHGSCMLVMRGGF